MESKMIIIGEKLNSSIPRTLTAMKEHEEEYIISLIHGQNECGAEYLDINTALCDDECDSMLWILGLAAANADCGVMIDSTNAEVVAKAAEFAYAHNIDMIINSVTQTERLEQYLPIIKKYGTGVIGLPMGDGGIPPDAVSRAAAAGQLIERLLREGIGEEKIYIDAMVEALAVGDGNPTVTLDTVRAIKEKHPNIKTVCGLSNVSYGLPGRKYINAAFLAMAVRSGLDAAIIDITSEAVRDAIYSSLALSGADEYCMNYITYMREKQ